MSPKELLDPKELLKRADHGHQDEAPEVEEHKPTYTCEHGKVVTPAVCRRFHGGSI
jgi:hypothetical protein